MRASSIDRREGALRTFFDTNRLCVCTPASLGFDECTFLARALSTTPERCTRDDLAHMCHESRIIVQMSTSFVAAVSIRRAGTAERISTINWQHDLGLDLKVIVASKCDLRSLGKFPQACRDWRDAVLASDIKIWKTRLSTDFPRAISILDLLPTLPPALSYKMLYKTQVAAESPVSDVRPMPTCNLAEFIFTFELVVESRRELLRSWTGTLSNDTQDESTFRVPFKWDDWMQSVDDFDQGFRQDVTLVLYVSRVYNDVVRTVQIFKTVTEHLDWNANPIEADLGQGELIRIYSDNDLPLFHAHPFEGNLSRLAPELTFTLRQGDEMDVDFRLNHPDVDGQEIMVREQLLRYLEYCVPW